MAGRRTARAPLRSLCLAALGTLALLQVASYCFAPAPGDALASVPQLRGQSPRVGSADAVAVPPLQPAPSSGRLRSASLVLLVAGVGLALAKHFEVDVPLLAYFGLWYLGNYYYNITNKLALNAAGGVTGFPLTISTLQLGVGCLYAAFLWAAPDARPAPQISIKDVVLMLPVGVTFAGAHMASVFALNAGGVSFGQIVKAAEPAFAAVIGTAFYGSSVSSAKKLCLIPVIGGVILASLGELDFSVAALVTASLANIFAAVKGSENKKLMSTPGLKDRLASVGNQFAVTTILGFLISIPLVVVTEGDRLGIFFREVLPRFDVWSNLVYSGMCFYLYNEVATLTMKKTSAITQSVANTAKRVIVIVGVAIVMGESLPALKLVGSAIGIGGVFVYSIIDDLLKAK